MPRKTKAALIESLDAFTRSYIECALWSSTDNADDSGGEPLDRNYSIEDITRKTLVEMIADCDGFRELCAKSYEPGLPDGETFDALDGISDESAGYDFWLTRNGHGAGFWDRGYRREVSDALCKWAKSYGGCDLMVWRGKIHS